MNFICTSLKIIIQIHYKIVDFICGTLCLRNQLFEEMLNKVALKVEANAMQCTDQVRTVVASLLAQEQRTWRQWFWQYVSGQLPTSVSVDAFVKSVLGDAAQDDQVKKLEATLKAEGDKLTEFLRARSRWVSFVVALALALLAVLPAPAATAATAQTRARVRREDRVGIARAPSRSKHGRAKLIFFGSGYIVSQNRSNVICGAFYTSQPVCCT